jgi:hypothetical protein
MFANRSRGSCTSTAIYVAGCLRALGIPTRIVYCVPCVDAGDQSELAMVRKNVTHHQVRQTILGGVEPLTGSWASHTFNEVWVGGRWRRLNNDRLGQPPLDRDAMGLMTHVATLRDWADGKAAATIGKRQGTNAWKDSFGGPNPYSAESIEDRFGAHCKLANPPAAEGAGIGLVSTLKIEAVAWSDDPSLPEGIPDPPSNPPKALYARVKDRMEFDVIKAFTKKADPKFFLEAAGHPTLSVDASVGGVTHPNGNRWVVIRLGPADQEALVRNVSYAIRPRNEKSDYRWVVADGLTVVRK